MSRTVPQDSDFSPRWVDPQHVFSRSWTEPEQLGLTLLLRLLGSGFPAGTLIVHRRLGQER